MAARFYHRPICERGRYRTYVGQRGQAGHSHGPRRSLDVDGDRGKQAGSDQHLPWGEHESARRETVRAHGDDRDRPARGGGQEHRVSEGLVGCVRPKGRCRDGEHAQQAQPYPEQSPRRGTLAQPPGRERDDPDRRRKGEHGGSPGWKGGQGQCGQRRISGHLEDRRNSDQWPVGSGRKRRLAPREPKREEARGCDRVAEACVPDRRHGRDADLDRRPAGRPA